MTSSQGSCEITHPLGGAPPALPPFLASVVFAGMHVFLKGTPRATLPTDCLKFTISPGGCPLKPSAVVAAGGQVNVSITVDASSCPLLGDPSQDWGIAPTLVIISYGSASVASKARLSLTGNAVAATTHDNKDVGDSRFAFNGLTLSVDAGGKVATTWVVLQAGSGRPFGFEAYALNGPAVFTGQVDGQLAVFNCAPTQGSECPGGPPVSKLLLSPVKAYRHRDCIFSR